MIAYGSLTIVDLLDTATYIYYAEDAEGTNPSASPENKKFIGIYSGPQFEGMPDKFPMDDWQPEWWSGWTKYIGDNGAPGEPGKGIKDTIIAYASSNSNVVVPEETAWKSSMTEASPQPGQYLWIRTILVFDDGIQSEPAYSISYIAEDGQDVTKYQIQTTQEEILKFSNNSSPEQKELSLIFSPNIFEIRVFDPDPKKPNGGQHLYFQDTSEISLQIFNHNKTTNAWIQMFPNEIVNDEAIKNPQEKEDAPLYIDKLNNQVIVFNLENFSKRLKYVKENVEDFVGAVPQEENNPTYTEELTEYNQKREKYEDWVNAAEILISGETVLRITHQKKESEETYITEKYVRVRYNFSEDMAKFSVQAQGIVAAMADTKMVFDVNGLKIKNGAFRIVNQAGMDVLAADTNGNLMLTGRIKATDSEFTGKVTATAGEIGGFNIDGGILRGGQNLSIDGAKGIIEVNNLQIGEGATITGYINLGDYVTLQQPSKKNNEIFLQASIPNPNEQGALIPSMSFRQDGTIFLGDANYPKITISGPTQTISGVNWSIAPDLATFENVTISGAIRAASFEYGVVQAVGGMLYVRPSSKIVEVEQVEDENETRYKVTLETNQLGFNNNDVCYINNVYWTIKKRIENSNLNKLILYFSASQNSNKTISVGSIIISMGQAGSVGIAINGSEHSSFMLPKAITLYEFNGVDSRTPRAILGEIPEEYRGGSASKYGLYAENAVLTGQLTTGDEPGVYSGIGTSLYDNAPSSVGKKDWFPNATLGQILIWAGAEDATKEKIEQSKFFVDKYGNMYAGSAYFNGTIISDSYIEASTIRTATIIGSGEDQNPALIIKDTSKGISFRSGDAEVFGVADSGFITDLQTTINNSLSVKGNKNGPGEITSNILSINGLGDDWQKRYLSIHAQQGQTYFDSQGILFSTNDNNTLQLEDNVVSIWGNLQYKESSKIVYEYKQAIDSEGKIIGYDIYVYD